MVNSINISAIDSDAMILVVVGYLIVFVALALLYAVFFNMPRILALILNKKPTRKKKSGSDQTEKEEELELSGEVNAAISLALYLYFNQYHDIESTNMTIKRESRLYSPWSSKIYQVRNQFNRL